MGRSVVFNGIEITVPGAYSLLDVSRLLTPTSGGVGIIALVGESNGGKPGLHLFEGGLSSSVVKRQLKSGPGADMVRLALRSGADTDVPAGASTVLFFKTNNSTQGQKVVGSPAIFTIKSKQYGDFVNQYTAAISTSMGSKFLTITDEDGIPETSPGVGLKNFMSINRDTSGGAIAAQVSLLYVSGALKLKGEHDIGAGLVTAFDIDVTAKNLKQIKQLVETFSGWTVTIGDVSDEGMKAIDLDMVVSAQTSFDTTPYGFKASVFELIQWADNISLLVDIERGNENDVVGVPSSMDASLLTGGSRGTTSNSNVQTAYNELLKVRVNITVPLFSKDSQDGSSVVYESVQAIWRDHLINRSSILGRSECQGYIGMEGNKDAFKAACKAGNTRWGAVTSQKIRDIDIDGNVVEHREYGFAVVCAQTQAGSPIGTPLTGKLLPILGISQHSSWNPIENATEMIKAGALIAGPDEDNNLTIINGYSSWTGDDNNANIFIEVVESLAIFAYNHRKFMKKKFVGKSSFTTQDILDAIKASCEAERDTTRSIKGFDLSLVKLTQVGAGQLRYEVAVEPFEGTVFVLPTIVAIREAAA